MAILRDQRGATFVLVALFLIILLLFIGLALDIGWATYVKNQGQGRVDSAALAAAAALVSNNPDTRKTNATTWADAFSALNIVVNPSVNPKNMVDPMFYDLATNALTLASDFAPKNANAVRVTNVVPTPLFLSGVRKLFGQAETCTNTDGSAGQNCTNISVGAVGYLGCPGLRKPGLPIMLCKEYVDWPKKCDVPNLFQTPSAGNSAFTDFNTNNNCQQLVNNPSLIPSVGVGDIIRLINGQIDSCLQAIEANYFGKCVLVPVVSCPNGQLVQSAPVAGFAELCVTEVVTTGSDKKVVTTQDCTKNSMGPSGGQCFGVAATNPILVR